MEADKNVVEAQNQLAKMTFIFLVFYRLEYGLLSLARLGHIPESDQGHVVEASLYRKFLQGLGVFAGRIDCFGKERL